MVDPRANYCRTTDNVIVPLADKGDRMKLTTVWEYNDIKRLQYGVVVEGWRHIGYGRGKRMFEAEFSEEEQKHCRDLYKQFLKWYSGVHGTGTPKAHASPIERYRLAVRLCNFFGTKL
jgi:hypothetical protein